VARKRSPNRDRAFEIYKKNGGKITNREIANLLGEDEKVIAVWKSRDKWNVVQQSKQCCATNKRGGRPGNWNAVGNSGGAAPPGNKNALKTGEFETLLFDTLEEDEKLLAGLIQPDKQQLLLQEIRLLTIRERRMLKRIEAIRQSVEYMEDGSSADGFTAVSRKTGMEKGKPTDLTEYRGKLGQMQAIEEALTRVQARKQQAINALHRFHTDDAKLEIDLMKLDLMAARIDRQETETEDDGFLDALNADAGQLWSDADEF